MKRQWILVATAAMGLSSGMLPAAAQDSQSAGQNTEKPRTAHWYNPVTWGNPIRWIKRDSGTASEQLAANDEQEQKLTSQLKAKEVLAPGKVLKEACSTFRSLAECVAALHVSHNLKLEFNCLKYDLTGIDPTFGKSSCAGPPGGKAIGLTKAIQLLKPEADARAEAKNALRQARGDLSDASS